MLPDNSTAANAVEIRMRGIMRGNPSFGSSTVHISLQKSNRPPSPPHAEPEGQRKAGDGEVDWPRTPARLQREEPAEHAELTHHRQARHHGRFDSRPG